LQFAIRAPSFRWLVRSSPRNDSVCLLVLRFVIDAACELVHLAAGKLGKRHFEK
jgi:hypothetical protein